MKGSTLFIRGVEDLTLTEQIKLREFLDQGRKCLKIRIIASVRNSLQGGYDGGLIHESLLEGLSKFERMQVPPLRDRTEDIPILAEHFAADACREFGFKPKKLDNVTLDCLARHDWRVNIRELKAVIEKSVYHSDGLNIVLPPGYFDEMAYLSAIIQDVENKGMVPMDMSLGKIEELLLRRLLGIYGLNHTLAAEAIGLQHPALQYRLKKYGISDRWGWRRKIGSSERR